MSTDIKAVVTAGVARGKGKKDADAADVVLTELAAAGVELVADLPTPTPTPDGYLETERIVVGDDFTAETCRKIAAEYLAVAKHKESAATPTPEKVDALAEALRAASEATGGDLQAMAEILARTDAVPS
jgi:hypothetical protein